MKRAALRHGFYLNHAGDHLTKYMVIFIRVRVHFDYHAQGVNKYASILLLYKNLSSIVVLVPGNLLWEMI